MARPKKPLHEKRADGNPIRADRDIPDLLLPPRLPPQPKWLGKIAKAEWDVLAPKLLAYGLLADVDGVVLAMHCDTYEKLQMIQGKLAAMQRWVDMTPNGYVIQSVWFNIRNKLHDQLLATTAQLGLSAKARSGIRDHQVKTPKQGDFFAPVDDDKQQDPFAPVNRH